MRFLIDGYNFLFRRGGEEENLQEMREKLLDELKVAAKKRVIAIVFDGAQHPDDISRGHLGDLEVHYTNSGQSADDYIIDELLHAENPRQVTLITSDKGLTRRAKGIGAETQTVEKFDKWLRKLLTL